MIERFFKRTIQDFINKINPLDLISENIVKIRKEIKTVFYVMEESSQYMKNLGVLLTSSFDKTNLVAYDEIMETVCLYLILYSNCRKV